MATLIRLISGSDVKLLNGSTGTSIQRGKNRTELEANIEKQVKDKKMVVPSLEEAIEYLNEINPEDIQVGLLFIDQAPYVEASQNMGSSLSYFRQRVQEDGIYWKSRVLQFCARKDITALTANVVFEANGDGMGNFEEVACRMDVALDAIASQVEGRLIVQHNTGNPIVDMSLLMWGMKQRKAGRKVSFLVNSFNDGEQEHEFTLHEGAYWGSLMGF